MSDLLKIYFKKWQEIISFRKYDEWCQTEEARNCFNKIQQEEKDEQDYACKTGMDPIYWCWNCKYSICDKH